MAADRHRNCQIMTTTLRQTPLTSAKRYIFGNTQLSCLPNVGLTMIIECSKTKNGQNQNGHNSISSNLHFAVIDKMDEMNIQAK